MSAALAVVDADGVDGLSMRSVAARLGSGTATLYRHFAGRAELVAEVVDEVFAEVDLALVDGASEQARVQALARALFDALVRHPRVAGLIAERIPVGPHAMALRQRWLAEFLDQGFTPESAAAIYATLVRYVLGFAIQFSSPDADLGPAAAAFRAVDPERYFAVRAASECLPISLEAEFAFGLDLLVRGLAGVPRASTK